MLENVDSILTNRNDKVLRFSGKIIYELLNEMNTHLLAELLLELDVVRTMIHEYHDADHQRLYLTSLNRWKFFYSENSK
jgi:hypothetical protein